MLPEGATPELARVQGTDAAEVALFEDGATGTAIVICAIDNLGKGAAGQAVQNANLALGLARDGRAAARGGARYERHRRRRASSRPASTPGSAARGSSTSRSSARSPRATGGGDVHAEPRPGRARAGRAASTSSSPSRRRS